MRDGYVPNFVSDMGASLGPHYAALFPICKTTVLTEVDAYAEQIIKSVIAETGGAVTAEMIRANFVEPFRSYLLRSGKYIRPYLVGMLLEAYGRPRTGHERVMASAEIIHSASLILDDIADDSVLRRGAPTAHTIHGTRLAGACASAWLNAPIDILAGEPRSFEVRAALVEAMAWEHFVTGLGTTIDVTWAAEKSLEHDPDEYLQQVVHRSTSYTYRLPIKLGAIAAEAPPSDIENLSAFGERIGLAFQLIDDILNVRPGDAHWGKEIGEDVAQGKITLQVLVALGRASARQRQRLLSVLGSGTHDVAALADAINVLDETEALSACRDRAHALLDGALAIVDKLSIDGKHRSILHDFAHYVVRRQR